MSCEAHSEARRQLHLSPDLTDGEVLRAMFAWLQAFRRWWEAGGRERLTAVVEEVQRDPLAVLRHEEELERLQSTLREAALEAALKGEQNAER